MTKNVADMLDPKQIIMAMAERNPGALSVMMDVTNSCGPIVLSTVAMWLDMAGIYGSDIWVGYKDHCNHDIQKFVECVADADPDMLKTINEYREQCGNPPLSWNHSS